MRSIAVIGSGVAGLASAVLSAQKGYDVSVFEANNALGGKAGEIRKEGFRFDRGPSLFTMPEVLDEIFISCGKDPSDYYSYSRLPVSTKYFYPDGKVFHAYAAAEDFAKEFERVFGERSEHVLEYLHHAQKVFELTEEVFLKHPLRKAWRYIPKHVLPRAASLGRLKAFTTLNALHKKFFTTPEAIQLFNRYATYNGSDPYRAPGTMAVISHLEHNHGAFIMDKGMHQVVQSLIQLGKELGVEYHINRPVEEILLEKRKACGIRVGSDKHLFDRVITNMDVQPTYDKLLPSVKPPQKVLNQEKSTSALIFYWGVQGEHSDLDVHNILFSAQYEQEFTALRQGRVSDDPTVYLYISKKHIQDDAPNQAENWFVMINVPHDSGQDWDAIVAKAKANILDKIESMLNISLVSKIQFEQVWTPKGIESDTSSYAGALYGNASNSPFSAFFRHSERNPSIRNLRFVGGGGHPGGGVPLCLLSAKIAVEGL